MAEVMKRRIVWRAKEIIHPQMQQTHCCVCAVGQRARLLLWRDLQEQLWDQAAAEAPRRAEGTDSSGPRAEAGPGPGFLQTKPVRPAGGPGTGPLALCEAVEL